MNATQAAPSNETLASLAHWMGLAPSAAIALPAVIETAARKVEMTQAEMVQRCWGNGELRAYLASVCRKVTS